MRLRYENTFDDLIAFQEFHIAHSPTVQKSLVATRWVGALSVLFILSLLGWFEQSWLLPVLGVAGGAVMLVLVPDLQRRSMRTQLAKLYREGSNKGVLGWHELQIKEDGILERSEFGEQKTVWQGVERVASTDKHTFIYVGSLMAHVIPHERVAEGNCRAFVQKVGQRRLSKVAQPAL